MAKMTRTQKINLAGAIALVIVGLVVLYWSCMLYEFRLHGGYSDSIPDNSFMLTLSVTGIMILEWGTGMVGVASIALGSIKIYRLIKKKRMR